MAAVLAAVVVAVVVSECNASTISRTQTSTDTHGETLHSDIDTHTKGEDSPLGLEHDKPVKREVMNVEQPPQSNVTRSMPVGGIGAGGVTTQKRPHKCNARKCRLPNFNPIHDNKLLDLFGITTYKESADVDVVKKDEIKLQNYQEKCKEGKCKLNINESEDVDVAGNPSYDDIPMTLNQIMEGMQELATACQDSKLTCDDRLSCYEEQVKINPAM